MAQRTVYFRCQQYIQGRPSPRHIKRVIDFNNEYDFEQKKKRLLSAYTEPKELNECDYHNWLGVKNQAR